jgi:hypothetical protein
LRGVVQEGHAISKYDVDGAAGLHRSASSALSQQAKYYGPGFACARYCGANGAETFVGARWSSSSQTSIKSSERRSQPFPGELGGVPEGANEPLVWANALFDASFSSSQEAYEAPWPRAAGVEAVHWKPRPTGDGQSSFGKTPAEEIDSNANSKESCTANELREGLIRSGAVLRGQTGSVEFAAGWTPLAIDDPSVLFSSFDLLRESRASSSVSALLQSMEAGAVPSKFRDSFVTNAQAECLSTVEPSWTDIFTSCRTAAIGDAKHDGVAATWTTCHCLSRHDGPGEPGPGCASPDNLEQMDILSTVDLLTGALTVATGLGEATPKKKAVPHVGRPKRAGSAGSPITGIRSRGVMDIVRGLEDVNKLTKQEAERQNSRLKRASSVGAPARTPWGSSPVTPWASVGNPAGFGQVTNDRPREDKPESESPKTRASVSATARSFWQSITKGPQASPAEKVVRQLPASPGHVRTRPPSLADTPPSLHSNSQACGAQSGVDDGGHKPGIDGSALATKVAGFPSQPPATLESKSVSPEVTQRVNPGKHQCGASEAGAENPQPQADSGTPVKPVSEGGSGGDPACPLSAFSPVVPLCIAEQRAQTPPQKSQRQHVQPESQPGTAEESGGGSRGPCDSSSGESSPAGPRVACHGEAGLTASSNSKPVPHFAGRGSSPQAVQECAEDSMVTDQGPAKLPQQPPQHPQERFPEITAAMSSQECLTPRDMETGKAIGGTPNGRPSPLRRTPLSLHSSLHVLHSVF